MKKISSKEFTHTFCDIWSSPDRRICFILGAGASRSSGIRTGGELAKKWLEEIQSRLEDQPEKFNNFIEKNKIQREFPGLNYPEIYQERFSLDITTGIDFINQEIENKRPGYGYSVLAQILAEKQHNIVITTNFDNLTEEALYTFSDKRPLICGHESLAAFAKPSIKRPLIVKIHRDRFFDPQSLPAEIEKMNDLWVEALNNIFSISTPVFIGYGGNDGSVMGYLEKINRLNNIFWCEMKGAVISERVQKLLDKHNGKLVEIEGFDELLFTLQDGLKLKLLDKEIVEIANSRAKNYQETVEKIRDKQANSTDKDTQEAAKRLVEKAENDWWYWELKAQAAKTSEEKESFYKEGIRRFPFSADLCNNYAVFLTEIKKDYNEAEDYYKRALTIDEKSFWPNNNYANLLTNIKKNYNDAKKYYKKALEIEPNNALVNANYAIFLEYEESDYDEAEKYYIKALEIEPNTSAFNSKYASFLSKRKKSHNDAEKYYRTALEIEPNNRLNNVKYAIFLIDIKKDYIEAEKFYCKAIDIDPTNASSNGNYAGLLFLLNRNDEALNHLDRAFLSCTQEGLEAELWFYKYAYIPVDKGDSFKRLENLLCNKVRSLNFNLQDNVDDAIKKGHPDPELLQQLADILTKDYPTGDLCNAD